MTTTTTKKIRTRIIPVIRKIRNQRQRKDEKQDFFTKLLLQLDIDSDNNDNNVLRSFCFV